MNDLVTVLTARGQTSIPASIRRKVGMLPGRALRWELKSPNEWLESKRPDGLVVCPVSVVEVTPQFGGEIEEVRGFLALLGIRGEPDWIYADTRAASLAWSAYVARKRLGRSIPKHPVADILIGAFCTRFGGLLTRNPDHFSPWFPGLALPRPEKH